MTASTSVRVRGHKLYGEGNAYHVCTHRPEDECSGRRSADGSVWHVQWGFDGRAVCECGAHSTQLGSNAARQRWHREHKAQVLNDVPGSEEER